jgi:hypothetical protein
MCASPPTRSSRRRRRMCSCRSPRAGHSAIVTTGGNEDCHVILRGGKEPNYDAEAVDKVCRELAAAGVPAKVMIDFSHANSRKQCALQMDVARDVAAQLACGEERIFGVMVESHLKEGRQDLVAGKEPEYGMSITDACLGWEKEHRAARHAGRGRARETPRHRRPRLIGESVLPDGASPELAPFLLSGAVADAAVPRLARCSGPAIHRRRSLFLLVGEDSRWRLL